MCARHARHHRHVPGSLGGKPPSFTLRDARERTSGRPRAAARARRRGGRGADQAAAHGELVVLAVKGSAAVEALDLCGGGLDGKAVIDTTNPIADAPPVNGVLRFFTGPNDSLLERLQARAPRARLVKAFSCVGGALMVDPALPGGPPTMFVCGDDAGAKGQVTALLGELGWEVEDAGGAEAARAIEPLCILWCIPGFLGNDWVHAFEVLRP